jgi:hypothetical protein
MVLPPGSSSSSPYAPVNEAARPGIIKYLNHGADSVIKQRRESAYHQMFSACNGKYRIDAEGTKSEGGQVIAMPTPMGSSAMWVDTQYWYIQFSCIP